MQLVDWLKLPDSLERIFRDENSNPNINNRFMPISAICAACRRTVSALSGIDDESY